MFQSLSDRLGSIFGGLLRRGMLTEQDVDTALREVRVALLEADVALPVVKQFLEEVKAEAVGADVIKSVNPGHMVVKIVHDRITALLGSEHTELNLSTTPPAVILMVGLQGSGKTTSTGKLALRLRDKGRKKVLVASLDVQRPAAQEQLAVLAAQAEVGCVPIVAGEKPLAITDRALQMARLEGYDVLLLDTAGRLHIDTELMDELAAIKTKAKPIETLLVADALTGQDAVQIADQFHKQIGVTGIILTRADGDARGGAALSMRQVTGCPIKFLGIGEKQSELEPFHPERLASRILDMGDIVSLVEKAAENMESEEAEKTAARMQKGIFDLDDMASQLRQMRKMGGISSMLGMLPGIGQLKQKIGDLSIDEKIFSRQEAIISSMTKKERKNPRLIDGSRKRRIAAGSGVEVQEVNRLLKQHRTMSDLAKKFSRGGARGMMQSFQQMMGGMR
jgi:signal recognition particle subunit SRP54